MGFLTALRGNRAAFSIALMMLSSVLFVAMAFAGRLAIAHTTIQMVVFARCAIALIPVVPIAVGASGKDGLRMRKPWVAVVAGLLMVTGLFTYFLSINYLAINDVIVLSFANVLFMTALSRPFLGERVGIHRWGAVLVGFAGVLPIANPTGGDPFSIGNLLAVVSAVTSGMVWLVIRRFGATENSGAVTVWMLGTGAIVAGVQLPFVWITPTWWEWPAILGVGVFGGLAQLTISNSYRVAPIIAMVAPFTYSQVVWSALGAWMLWHEAPTVRTIGGAVLIVGAGIYLAMREARGKTGAVKS